MLASLMGWELAHIAGGAGREDGRSDAGSKGPPCDEECVFREPDPRWRAQNIAAAAANLSGYTDEARRKAREWIVKHAESEPRP
jgi:hypothetical protein